MDMWPLDGGMTAPRFDRVFVQDICAGKFLPDIAKFPFRDPDVFIAGQPHQFPEIWEQVAPSGWYDKADEVLDWLKHKVSLSKFFKAFKGNFKGVAYDSDIPPAVEFGNNKSCNSFHDFIIRDLGHEKNSQHVFIKSVILRQSFLSATERIISTRAVGMCPCGYLTA